MASSRPRSTFPLLSLVLLAVSTSLAAQDRQNSRIDDEGTAVAKSGTVPIVQVGGPSGDFDVFIEGPEARRALYGPMIDGE